MENEYLDNLIQRSFDCSLLTLKYMSLKEIVKFCNATHAGASFDNGELSSLYGVK